MPTNTAQLFPEGRRFQDLLLPFLSPYLIYIAVSNIPGSMIPLEAVQSIKLIATSAVLLFFIKCYRFGPFSPRHVLIALAALPIALLAWILPFYGLAYLGLFDGIDSPVSDSISALSLGLRVINSVILVAVFEELFVRVYVMGWLFQAGPQRKTKSFIDSIADTLDQYPHRLPGLPLSTFSVVGTTIVFTAGHLTHEYPSAILYFLYTTWIYKKFESLWVCIIIHGLTNLAILLLAAYGGMGWLV